MDKKKKMRCVAFALLLFLICYTGFQMMKVIEARETGVTQDTEQKEETEEETSFHDQLLKYDFGMKNLEEEAMRFMELEPEELSESLKEWTYNNGYSTATSAFFYPMLEVDYEHDTYRMTLKLNDDSETLITMKYHKDRRNLEFRAMGTGSEERSGGE